MLRLFNRLSIAKKNAPLVMGESGIFVKPTAALPVTGVYPYSYANLENAFDNDLNTFGVIQSNSDNNQYNASINAKFTFGMIHPGGKLRIKHKYATALYAPGGLVIKYSPNLDGSGMIQLFSVGGTGPIANPIISEFVIPGNIAMVEFSTNGGGKYSSASDEIYDIALEL